MNSKDYEKWILLDQAGELSEAKRKKLHTAIEADPQLKAFQHTLEQVSAVSSEVIPSTGVDTANILRYARRHQAHTREKESFFNLWQPAMGYAAITIALTMVGLYYFQQDFTATPQMVENPSIEPEWMSWEAPYETELAQLKTEVQNLQDNFLQETTPSESLNDLATTLLLLGESS